MHLEGAGRHHRAHRALNRLLNDASFRLSGGKHEAPTAVEYGANPHSNGPRWHLVGPPKEGAVLGPGLGSQGLSAGAGGQGGEWLIEGQVAVDADAEQLEVNAPGALDLALIPNALRLKVLCHPVRKVGVGALDVDVLKERTLHRAAVRLWVACGDADVLVQVERGNAREVEVLARMLLAEQLVDRLRRPAGCEPQHCRRLGANGVCNELGSEGARLFGCWADYDFDGASCASFRNRR